MSFVYEHALRGVADEFSAQALSSLASDAQVSCVEPDQVVYAFNELPTNDAAKIDGSDQRVDVDVAILDTGIASHPDLNIAGGVKCTAGGIVRPTCKSGGYADANGHGTHVAGIAAAREKGSGVVAVAPGARLWAVKVLGDSGSG